MTHQQEIEAIREFIKTHARDNYQDDKQSDVALQALDNLAARLDDMTQKYQKAEEQRAYASMALQRVEDDYIQLRTEHMTPEEFEKAYAGMDEPSSTEIIADVLEKRRKSEIGMPHSRLIFDDGIDVHMDGED